MRRDYLIVGSGLSALAFTVLMARAGKRVTAPVLKAGRHLYPWPPTWLRCAYSARTIHEIITPLPKLRGGQCERRG